MIKLGEKISLSPAYDLLNTSIAIGNPQEELALPRRGKKSKLKKTDLIEYFGIERLNLAPKPMHEVLKQQESLMKDIRRYLDESFMTNETKKAYAELCTERIARVF